MSWSIAPVKGRSDDPDGLRAALLERAQPQQGYAEEESRIAVAVAIDALISLAATCGEYVQLGANGHANPNHTPESGWSVDAFTLSISAATPPQEATP
ncbi:MAG TPA: hypothetical protein VNW96_19170 [Mycobacterium sp.]|jgi:hypothetical protein|nr:hypothetical protein [Mycobacterium sp.]